jgi:hypothetical protein
MISGEAEGIEVLRSGDDGVEGVVVAVGRGGEFGLDDGARDADRVVLLNVQTARDGRRDVGRDIIPLINGVCLAVYSDFFGRRASSWDNN